MSFDFLFWGSNPGDWLEGANDGHAYELRFATAPSAEQRRAVGEAFFAALKKAPATASVRDWLWSGPWAVLFVGEKKAGHARALFAHMASVFAALHKAHPLAEVIYWNARTEGTDDWERWTREQSAKPTPGPNWAGLAPMGMYARERDATLASGTSDPAFELARVGKKAANKTGPTLKVSSVLAGVSGYPLYPENAALPAPLAGDLRAAHLLPSGAVIALTTQALCLVDAQGAVLATRDPAGAIQLSVTTRGIAVTITPAAEVRAYQIGAASLDLVGETTAKKFGTMWAKDERVFLVNVASYFEIAGWPLAT